MYTKQYLFIFLKEITSHSESRSENTDISDSVSVSSKSMTMSLTIGVMSRTSLAQYFASISSVCRQDFWNVYFLIDSSAVSVNVFASLNLNVLLLSATLFFVIPQIISMGFKSEWYGGKRSILWPHSSINFFSTFCI